MSMKVLLSDCDWRFTRQVCAYLESRAHLAVTCTDVAEAAQRAESWRPDLVILGAELAEKGLLERIYRLDPRPAVLLTEHMARYDRAWRVWQDGGDELLMKPIFKPEELQEAIVTAMENAASGAIMRSAKRESA